MKNCKAQKCTDWAESVKSRALQYPGWFGKHPATVLLDSSVSYPARVLFGVLALKTYKTRATSNTVQASTRGVAALMGTTAATISNWLGELQRAKHIERVSQDKTRGVYRLLSPVFSYRVKVETAPNATADVSSEHLPILRDKRRICPKCRTRARISSSSGVCDGCLRDWLSRRKGGAA